MHYLRFIAQTFYMSWMWLLDQIAPLGLPVMRYSDLKVTHKTGRLLVHKTHSGRFYYYLSTAIPLNRNGCYGPSIRFRIGFSYSGNDHDNAHWRFSVKFVT